jgi:hypothetical protein
MRCHPRCRKGIAAMADNPSAYDCLAPSAVRNPDLIREGDRQKKRLVGVAGAANCFSSVGTDRDGDRQATDLTAGRVWTEPRANRTTGK